MSNYTIGEWVAESSPYLVSVMCPSTAEVIAICGKPKWITDKGAQIANAHLIASAPDMYVALKEAKLQIEYLHDKFQETGTGNAILARIQIALNKADGK